jgi:methyl-accepting chemotaxis protein
VGRVRISIGVKLAVGFMLLLALLIGSGTWSYYSLNQVQANYTAVLDQTYPLLIAAEQLNGEIQNQVQMATAYAATRAERTQMMADSRKRIGEYMKVLSSGTKSDTILKGHVDKLEEQRARLDQMVDGLFKAGSELSTHQLILQADNVRAVGEVVGLEVGRLRTHMDGKVKVARASARAAARAGEQVLMIVLGVSVVIGFGVMLFIYRAVALPLRAVARQLQEIASGGGDLTRQLKVSSSDEVGQLAESFNRLVIGLRTIVHRVMQGSEAVLVRSQEVKYASEEVAGALSDVTVAVTQVAAGADRQTGEMQAASQTMGQLVGAIDHIAAGAQQQSRQAQQATIVIDSMVNAISGVAEQAASIATTSQAAAATARDGAVIVDQTLAGMNRVRDQVVSAAEKITTLGEYGSKIGEVMQVITGIAKQTNLLALNAAIEAARAGEQGRGFAVVAEEVRKLAERSALSASEIGVMIHSIQVGTQEAVSAIENGTVEVEEGARLAASAGKALEQILASVERTTADVQGISKGAQSVLRSSQDAVRAVEEVAAVTEEYTASTEEMAAGAEEVQSAMGGVNQVSMDNAEAVGSVSTSVQQVNQAVGSIADSVGLLTDVASELRTLMGQFKV